MKECMKDASGKALDILVYAPQRRGRITFNSE